MNFCYMHMYNNTVNVDDSNDFKERDNEERVAGTVDVHDVEEVEAALRDHGQTEQEEGCAEEETTQGRAHAETQLRKLVDECRNDALCRRKLKCPHIV